MSNVKHSASAAPATPLQFAALAGGADWHAVDFISDLHLQASEMTTFTAWQQYMQTTTASALFILGDLFEVWLGDDVLGHDVLGHDVLGHDVLDAASQTAASGAAQTLLAEPFAFEAQCARILRATAQRIPVFYMSGNRDFLLGADFLKRTHLQGLHDPTVLSLHSLNGQSYLLTHGDALCLDDVDYQVFRTMVRNPAWQAAFLAKPLAERQQIARHLRDQSEAVQTGRAEAGLAYSDVDEPAALQWLQQSGGRHMIHGHTHRPADHAVWGAAAGAQRYVLSDWEADTKPARLQVLRITERGVDRLPLLAS